MKRLAPLPALGNGCLIISGQRIWHVDSVDSDAITITVHAQSQGEHRCWRFLATAIPADWDQVLDPSRPIWRRFQKRV